MRARLSVPAAELERVQAPQLALAQEREELALAQRSASDAGQATLAPWAHPKALVAAYREPQRVSLARAAGRPGAPAADCAGRVALRVRGPVGRRARQRAGERRRHPVVASDAGASPQVFLRGNRVPSGGRAAPSVRRPDCRGRQEEPRRALPEADAGLRLDVAVPGYPLRDGVRPPGRAVAGYPDVFAARRGRARHYPQGLRPGEPARLPSTGRCPDVPRAGLSRTVRKGSTAERSRRKADMNFSFVHYGVMNMNSDNPRSAYWFRRSVSFRSARATSRTCDGPSTRCAAGY
jgi:hypothetical protein